MKHTRCYVLADRRGGKTGEQLPCRLFYWRGGLHIMALVFAEFKRLTTETIFEKLYLNLKQQSDEIKM